MNKMKRSPNFSEEEVDMLVQLVHLHRNIFQNKQCNLESKREKDAAWDTITDIFNMDKKENARRSKQMLKYKYENLSKFLRIKIADMQDEKARGVNIQSLVEYEELMLPMLHALEVARYNQDIEDNIFEYYKTQTEEKSDYCEFDEMKRIIAQLTKDTLMEDENMAREESEGAKEECVAETIYYKLEMEKNKNQLEILNLEQKLLAMQQRLTN